MAKRSGSAFAKRAGISRVGENRVQDALVKQQETSGVLWELIGHLQSNKANQVIGRFERIQTVDSLKLLGKLQTGAELKGVKCKNSFAGKHRGGSSQVRALVRKSGRSARSGSGLLQSYRGRVNDDSSLCSWGTFRCPAGFWPAKRTRDRLNKDFDLGMKELSMGMSGDLREAIESGSTMVRVGSALFGERVR